MVFSSARAFFVTGTLLVAGFATVVAQDAATTNPGSGDTSFRQVNIATNQSFSKYMLPATAMPDNVSKAPQAIGASPEKQLTACPPPAKLFPLSEYTGPGRGLVNPSSRPVVPRGLDGRPCNLSVGEKFALFAKTTVRPNTYVLAAWNAGVAQVEDNDPEWGQGAEGYGQRYAAAFTDQVSRNFFRKFAYPSVFRQDARYFRSEESGGGARFRHALAHTFVTRSDSGGSTLNYSQWFGTASAVALGNLYHPGHKRGFTPAAERFGISVGTDMGFDVLREFWPDMVRKFHLPFHARQ
jgi:hypothetical protein